MKNDENLGLIDYYMILQKSLSEEEFFRVNILLGTIISRRTFSNLTNDEINLLTRVIRVSSYDRKTPTRIFFNGFC